MGGGRRFESVPQRSHIGNLVCSAAVSGGGVSREGIMSRGGMSLSGDCYRSDSNPLLFPAPSSNPPPLCDIVAQRLVPCAAFSTVNQAISDLSELLSNKCYVKQQRQRPGASCGLSSWLRFCPDEGWTVCPPHAFLLYNRFDL